MKSQQITLEWLCYMTGPSLTNTHIANIIRHEKWRDMQNNDIFRRSVSLKLKYWNFHFSYFSLYLILHYYKSIKLYM